MAQIIALTGDIGAGKSTVACIMESYGGIRFDADVMARDMWLRPDVRNAAVARWGTDILSGDNVNFSAIAKKIFSSPIEYNWSCQILHPLVMTQLAKSVSTLSPDQWAIAEIPLLFEVGRPNWVNFVVYVTAPYDIRLERCLQRGWDEAELVRRENFYIPAEDRKRRSDFILTNDGNLDDLRQKVRECIAGLILPRGGRGDALNHKPSQHGF